MTAKVTAEGRLTAPSRTHTMPRMRRVALLVLSVLLAAGCNGSSSGGSTSSGAPTPPKNGGTSALGCDKDGDAAADLQTIQTGIADKTATTDDVVQQFSNMVGDLKTATEIDKPPALPLEMDAQLRAGRLRVDLLSAGAAPHLVADRDRLEADLSKLGTYCSS